MYMFTGDHVGSKFTGILPVETNSSDMDNRRECVSEDTRGFNESDSIPVQGESYQKDLNGSLELSHENSAPRKTSQDSSSTDKRQNNSWAGIWLPREMDEQEVLEWERWTNERASEKTGDELRETR